jgi:hypothetical protein
MSGQPHTLAALPTKNSHQYPLVWRLEILENTKIFCSARIQIPACPAGSPVTVLTALSRPKTNWLLL